VAREEGDVFVDPDGTMTVSASRALARLQARQGQYALVPSPPDLIILRRVSSMHSGSRVLLAGEIVERGTLLEILQFISQANWTGELLVVDHDVRRSILFDSGTVILATSNAPAERLGEILYRLGAISREQFEEALRAMGPARRLGDIVVQKGWIKPNDLYSMLQKQVEEIFYNTLAMNAGTFLFARGIDAAAVPVRVNLPAGALLMEGVQRIDEWAYFRERIPDSSIVPVSVPGKNAGGDAHGTRVLEAIDGRRTLEEISRLTGLGEFAATKALFALFQRGAAQVRKPPTAKETLLAQVEGFNEVLREVHRTVDEAGVGAEARATLSMFLQGGGAFDVLFANAGPLDDGSFAPMVLVGNLDRLHTDDPARVVQQALHDYVAFALFAAGSVLRREDHQALARRVQDQLTILRAPAR
jgi:hypothetical protein